MIWNSRIGNKSESFDHPLIKLIAKKICVSEQLNNINDNSDTKTMIQKYFPDSINGTHISQYLLLRTWFRPRDFSRMLRRITKQYGDMNKGFLQMHFEETQKAYATSSWTEIAEELAAKYQKGTISIIEKIFSNAPKEFLFEDIETIVKNKSKYLRELKHFQDTQNLAELLEDLFQIGFIGNVSPYRFHFRGDTSLDFERLMGVHRALWPHFSII